MRQGFGIGAGIALATCLAHMVQAQTPPSAAADRVGGPQMLFAETSFDFGSVASGATIEHVFTFKNIGTAPVIISNVSVSCGCIVPDWSREPVMPGQAGFVAVRMNTTGRSGGFAKSVWMDTNAAPPPGEGLYSLRITGTIAAENSGPDSD